MYSDDEAINDEKQYKAFSSFFLVAQNIIASWLVSSTVIYAHLRSSGRAK